LRGPRWQDVAAFAAGVIAGAMAGLMYAPADGATTRKNAAERASSGIEAASKGLEAASSVYSRTFDTGRFQIDRLFTAVSAGVEEARRTKEELNKLSGEFNEFHG